MRRWLVTFVVSPLVAVADLVIIDAFDLGVTAGWVVVGVSCLLLIAVGLPWALLDRDAWP